MNIKVCGHCGSTIPLRCRRDAIYCCDFCRKAHWEARHPDRKKNSAEVSET